MKKKILIAVGDCSHSRSAVKYAATLSQPANDTTYTLYNIQAAIPGILLEEAPKSPECEDEIEALVRERDNAAKCTVGELKDLLVTHGVPEAHIEAWVTPMEYGMAKDILDQAEAGNYDTIVLGSKGLTPRRDVFVGTTATKVVEHALKTSVWVIDEYTESRDILIAVDASENSLHVLDHVISSVGAKKGFRFVLFHVRPYLSHYYSLECERNNPNLQKLIQDRDRHRMEDFHRQAFDRFETAGITRSQVEIKTNEHGYDISTAILEEARRGAYGTVVIGRRGEREAFFTGRIAMRLVQKMPSAALWVVA
jgi:nucleotide-binding universal stress UspA family protein